MCFSGSSNLKIIKFTVTKFRPYDVYRWMTSVIKAYFDKETQNDLQLFNDVREFLWILTLSLKL